MELKRTNFVSHITHFGRLVAFLSMIPLLIVVALVIQQANSTSKTSTSMSNTYQQMLQTLSKEKALQDEYALHPSTAIRDEYVATATNFSYQVQALRHNSDASSARFVQQIVTQQTSYESYSGQFFSAIS